MDQVTNDGFDQIPLLEHYEVVQELGNCHATIGNMDLAKKHFEEAAALDPDAPGPYVGLGVVALQNDLLEDADIAFRVACRLDKKCSKAFAGQAMVAQRRNHLSQAFDLYLKSLELDTDHLTALLGLFQVSCEMGSFAQVIHYLKVYLTMHPADTSVMFSLAALYMKEGRLEKARQLLADVLILDPDNSDAEDLLEEVEYDQARLAVAQRYRPYNEHPYTQLVQV